MINKTTLDKIINVSIGSLSNYPPQLLFQLVESAEQELQAARKAKQVLELAITTRYDEQLKAQRLHLEKDTGTVHIRDEDFKLSCDIPKKVEWNQRKLRTIVSDLVAKGADMNDLVEITYKIPERRFKGWSQIFQEIFIPARIVRTGKPIYKLVRIDVDQQEVCYV